ncbi:MAG TPA: glycoside hydrolase family 88 protein [Pyrinomonadaceae bacterium]|jgi:unsaturated rhamnogalacturonyl hydrolase|nr:glycoside hydrolase family 88 protein [Pyrinomonadaceae bacterium]
MKRTLLTIVILLIFLNHSEVASRSKNSKPTDLSVAMVESTMKRYPTAKDLGAWGYAKSLYLYGQYLVYKRTREPRYLKYIKDWVDSHLDENGVVTNTNAQGVVSQIKYDNLDSMLPGNLLLLLYQETKEPKYKLAADRIRLRFNTYPRTKDGGFWHAASKSREWQLWGDGVFMSMPFLVRYGNLFGDSSYANDEATKQLLVYAGHLNDPKTGLMFHAYDESGQSTWADKETRHSAYIWCRAMGWFGMTLIEVLELLPKNHAARPKLMAQLNQLVKAWANYQDKQSGLWYQIVDKGQDPANWMETSSSSMYTFVTAVAAERGYVPKSYVNVAKKGYAGVLTKISLDSDGMTNIIDICEGTNVADLAYYFGRKRATNDFHGLGAFLIMNEKFMNKSLKGRTGSFWQAGRGR